MMIYRRLIAFLLDAANAGPPTTGRDEFYSLKGDLLDRYGSFQNFLIQEVVKECWGYQYDDGCRGKECRKCGGTGIYSQRLFSLKKWTFCGHEFLTPYGQLYGLPVGETVTINGRVEHAERWLDSREAVLWLYLLTGNFRMFWRELTHGGWRCSPGFWPMMRIQKSIGWSIWLFHRKRCWCGRMFFTWGSGWQICKKCRHSKVDTVPF